ncbi:MAG: hypothetical protein WCA30_18930 [Dermatophilaceae bacterium]
MADPAPSASARGPAPLPRLAPPGTQRDTRVAVLRTLVEADRPLSIPEVTALVGCHVNSARAHLDGLVEDGLAERTRVPSGGRGRPHYRYAAVTGADAALVAVESSDLVLDEYRGLVAAFATVLRAASASLTLETAREVGRVWAASLPTPRTRSGPRRRVFELLGRLGFSPRRRPEGRPRGVAPADADPQPDTRELIELRTCPLLDVATEFPDVICQAHHGLIEAAHTAAGGSPEGVELIPFAAPGACHVLLPRSVPPPESKPAATDESG